MTEEEYVKRIAAVFIRILPPRPTVREIIEAFWRECDAQETQDMARAQKH